MKKDYYLGLDVGTESVGWAASDEEYNILKLRGKNAIGAHCFNEAATAEVRRNFRSSKRRYERRKVRIALLNELFDNEICKVDNEFLLRLGDSKFFLEDKAIKQKNTLFNDKDFDDKNYHKAYPTIYHLRKDIIDNPDKKFDIRLIYLAIVHILKHRGHFLFEGQEFDAESSFDNIYIELSNILKEELDITLEENTANKLREVLISNNNKTNKQKEILKLIGNENKAKVEIIKLLVGGKATLSIIFSDSTLDESEEAKLRKIQFSDSSYAEDEIKYEEILKDRMEVINVAKKLYDWMILSNILKGSDGKENEKFISSAKIASYEKHKKDLKILKRFIRKNCEKSIYNDIFKENQSLNNYCAYIGTTIGKNNQSVCSRDVFYKFIENIIKDFNGADKDKDYILSEIEFDAFLPKQSTGDNGVIPYQLHLKELEIILNNSAKHYDFLNKVDNGITVAQKIISIMKFRIPYYVGPLNKNNSKNAWIVKKEEGKIYPWNFEEKVNLSKSGEEFIRRMTSRCTYLIGADVIPKDSILYSKFMVLNEINNIKINDKKIDVEIKQLIFNNLCLKKNKVRIKDIKNYLLSVGRIENGDDISGIDNDIKASMKSYIDFSFIIPNEKWDEKLIEESISTIVLFSSETKIIKSRIEHIWKGILENKDIIKICNLKYSGWGNLSREFLTDIENLNKETGELTNIITALWETNNNLMQLLSRDFSFINSVDETNAEKNGELTQFSYEKIVAPLYCSPKVKRGIWRALNIVKEIQKLNGDIAPKKIFIEVTREDGIKGDKGRKESRKNQLLKLYKDNGITGELLDSLKSYDDGMLRSRTLYLYYTQLGRCMYSNKKISLDNLFNRNIYDLDHIYPRSKTKDDSLDNLVLVHKNINKSKEDIYPIPAFIKKDEVVNLWNKLYKGKLISKEKYTRLMRTEEFSVSELSGFINRQIVETGQANKAIAQALKQIYSNEKTEIVYVKAKNVSDFRKEKLDRIKVREINDYHHGFDAYLNIVVGNVFNTKFTKDPRNFIRKEKDKYRAYSLNRMYDFKVERNGYVAWEPGCKGTILTVQKNMDLKRLQYTRYPHVVGGEFYNQMPLKAGGGQIPLKTSDKRLLAIEKYGAYNSDNGAYFFLVKHEDKKKELKTIEYVPVRYAKKIENDPNFLLEYCVTKPPFGLGLNNPKILIEKIKIDTLFNINGFPMHISGRTGDSIAFKPAVQLILDKESESYINKIVKFNEKKKLNKDLIIREEYDKITKEENIKIYDLLVEKNSNQIFILRPESQIKALRNGKEKFIGLSLEEQSFVLGQILNISKCSAIKGDISLIGGGKSVGSARINKKVNQCKKAVIIHQSVTGLYNTEVDLLKL